MQKEKPLWLKIKIEEVKELALDLSKKGMTPEKIGLVLRDQYGIPTTRVFGKKLSQLLNENKELVDLKNLKKKYEKQKIHSAKNKQDKVAQRTTNKTEGKINKLKRYYKKRGKDVEGN